MNSDSCDQMSRGNLSKAILNASPEYELLKPVSIKAIIQAQENLKCEDFWLEINCAIAWRQNGGHDIGVTWEWLDKTVFDYISDHPKAAQWLRDKGFIRVKEEELKACPFKTCGGMAWTRVSPEDGYWISCCACGARGPISDTREESRRKWNER